MHVNYDLNCFTEIMAWSPVVTKGLAPVARDGHTACVIDGCMYIFGGYEGDDQFSGGVYKLDLNTFVWSFLLTKVYTSMLTSHYSMS